MRNFVRLLLLTVLFLAGLPELGGSIPKADLKIFPEDAIGQALQDGASTTAYQYNLKGDVCTKTLPDGEVESTTYDGMSYYSNNRLQTEAVHAGANTSAEQTTSTTYTYDAIGNRTQKAVVGGLTTTYTYSNDELSGWSDTGGNSVSYTYDGNGNRSTRVQAGGTYNYGYDTENRLISLTQAGVTYGYLYDYRTRRVKQTDGGVLARLRLLRI